MKDEHLKNMAFAQSMEQFVQRADHASTADPFPEAELSELAQYEEFKARLGAGRIKQAQQVKSFIPDLQSFTAGLETAENLMAISGKVDPAEIKKKIAVEAEKCLDALSYDCIVNATDTLTWMLNQKKRIEVLNRLLMANTLKTWLNAPLPPTDRFGIWLREVLKQGANLPLEALQEPDLLSIIGVLETLAPLNIILPDTAHVKSYIQSNSLLADYAVLSAGFIGRTTELQQLAEFGSKSKEGEYGYYSDWEGLLLTGLGGVGKSTLLAKFTSRIMKNQEATTVILDFDRPGIDPRDTAWLELEISRQVGKQYQKAGEVLLKSRDRANYLKDDYGSESIQESSRSFRSVISDVKERLMWLGKTEKPFLLIMDTMEEATQRYLVGKLHEWIDDLCSSLHPINVKVIFSGRLYDEQKTAITSISKVNQYIELSEFEKPVAITFLESHGLTNAVSERIVATAFLPLRPLELKLVAKLIMEGATTLQELEDDFNNLEEKGALKQLFVGLIYQRVLRRMGGDELIGKIAYPGLILRYITEDIVQQVLQPALELPVIDKGKAKELVNKIASFNWLAYRGVNGEVYHRKDLRRSMLKLMIAQESKKVSAIRQKAIEYFESKGRRADKAEVLYHRLMMVIKPEDGEAFTLDELKLAYDVLSQDLADLPRFAFVLIQYAFDQTIHEEDIDLLPDKFFKLGFQSVGTKLVANRQFSKAWQVYKRAKNLGVAQGLAVTQWQNELLFSLGEWKDMKPQAGQDYTQGLASIRSFCNFIFPQALWRPETINFEELESFLKVTILRDQEFFRYSNDPEEITLLNRVAYCLANLNSLKAFGKKNEFTRPWKALNDYVARPENRLPANEKSVFILGKIFDDMPAVNYKLGVSLLKFEAFWLTSLQEFAPTQSHFLIENTAALFNKKEPATYTSRTLLSTVDGNKERKQWHEILIPLKNFEPHSVYQFIKGPDPMFRDPCRYAVLDAFTTYESRLTLAKLIQSVINISLVDLVPETFATMLEQNTELALEPAIEIIDRSWQLGNFLQLAQDAMPGASRLNLVANAYRLWEQSFKSLVLEKNNPTKF